MGHLVTPFQGQILRAAANNRVCGHASTRGHAPTSPIWCIRTPKTVKMDGEGRRASRFNQI